MASVLLPWHNLQWKECNFSHCKCISLGQQESLIRKNHFGNVIACVRWLCYLRQQSAFNPSWACTKGFSNTIRKNLLSILLVPLSSQYYRAPLYSIGVFQFLRLSHLITKGNTNLLNQQHAVKDNYKFYSSGTRFKTKF